MLKKSLLPVCLLLVGLLFVVPAHSQSIGDLDFRDMNVSELTPAQLERISSEIEDRGMSLNQFQQFAVSQGADARQVQRLIQMIRASRAGLLEFDRDDDFEDDPRMRRVEDPEDRDFVDREREEVSDSLRVFGEELFSQMARTFEPSFNVPTPMDYTIGPGDQIIIALWGAAQQTYQLRVNPEGHIRVPNLGPIYVNGMQFDAAQERILQRLTEIHDGLKPNNPEEANIFAQVGLGNVRSIKVTVMGEANLPGTYTVSSLSTVFNALYAAGGPNQQGSFRKIHIIRNNEIIETFDVYDFLVYGNQGSNIRLSDQDIIKIEPYQNRVHVWGETKRRGFFETIEGETIEDLLEYVAGFNDGAYTRRLELHRISPTMQRIEDIFYPEDADTELRNGDRLRVGTILDRYENRVSIEGAVFRPGDYEYEPGMTLFDLIQNAEGVREEAFMTRGVIHRVQADMQPEQVNFSVQRVIEEPEIYDIPLQRDDNVRISTLFDMQEEYTLRISGAVNRPRTIEYRSNMTLEDAIFRADGLRDNAAAYRVEVARRVVDAEERMKLDRIADIYSFDIDENLDFRDDADEFVLLPFDRVYVREKPNYQEQQTVTITGEVQYPGEYVLSNRNARLSDLVEMAGGLSDYAYVQGASLQRILEIRDREVEEEVWDDVALERGFPSTEVRTEIDTLFTAVGIRLGDALGSSNPAPADLILEAGDELHIPKELQTVRVEGEVLSPTSIRYDSGRSFSDYIDAAGGVTEDAKRRRAYIVYANGEVDRTRRILFFRSNPDVEPGATIVIPRDRERRQLTPQERVALASTIANTALVIVTIIDRLN